jgi:hypothetical protein
MKKPKPKTPKFTDDDIRRFDLPRDVFLILHDLCYDTPSRDRRGYKRRARASLRRRQEEKAPFPAHLTWLMNTLVTGYGDRQFVLEIIGDVAKLIRNRRKQKFGASNTTCIACGGWIPRDREDKRQHTCSENCQRWYRMLLRAKDAGKVCRHCGRGLPKNLEEWPKRRRPARPRLVQGKLESDAKQGYGATRQAYPVKLRIGESLPLVPNAKDGVEVGKLEEMMQEMN